MIQQTLGDEETPIINFDHNLESDGSERMITVHPTEDGMVVFSVFTPEEWIMVNNICEISEKNISTVVYELAEANEITTIVVDPKEY